MSRFILDGNKLNVSGAYAGGGGALGAHAPPTRKNGSAQKRPKEREKSFAQICRQKRMHVPLRYDKIKTKKVMRK